MDVEPITYFFLFGSGILLYIALVTIFSFRNDFRWWETLFSLSPGYSKSKKFRQTDRKFQIISGIIMNLYSLMVLAVMILDKRA